MYLEKHIGMYGKGAVYLFFHVFFTRVPAQIYIGKRSETMSKEEYQLR